MKLLNLSYNRLNDNGALYLSKCIHMIEELELEKCDIQEKGVQALAEQIEKRKEPVMKLFFYFNAKKNQCSARMIHVLKDCMSEIFKS